MGVSFFQTAPRDHFVRWAIFFNTVALILLLFAFGYSFDSDSKVSGIKLSTDYFENNYFAKVSGSKIFAHDNESIVCPQSEVTIPGFAQSDSTWAECDRYQEAAKASLGLDGCTIILLFALYIAQRVATTHVSDERRLLGIYFGLQLIPLGFHIISRLIFEGAAVRSAISFLKASNINGGTTGLSDEDVGLHYGPVQSLHAAVAALMAGALAFISLKFFQITLRNRIESVELVRECAARSRGDKPNEIHRPMRWMLDPRYHPLYDFDELETVRQKLAESNSENESAEMAALRARLEEADQQWKEQQEELVREEEAYKEYSHRIRREERVENRVVVDDWERQQVVWEERKAEVSKQFEEMGYSMPISSSTTNSATEDEKQQDTVNNNNKSRTANTTTPPAAEVHEENNVNSTADEAPPSAKESSSQNNDVGITDDANNNGPDQE